MKLAVAVAAENAPPSAFVVWRGFDESIGKAAERSEIRDPVEQPTAVDAECVRAHGVPSSRAGA